MPVSRVLAALVIVAALLTSACGDPPDREMQQAQGAIDAARAAGAERYAREEFTAAQDALKRANDAVEIGDYRLALNHALDSRERAQNAARMAADGMAAARVEADHAVSRLDTALTAADAALKEAEGRRTPARELSDLRESIAVSRERLQEARAALEKGDYAPATESAEAAADSLDAAVQEARTASAPAPRRPR
jgi:hypothetical protein